MQSSSELEFKPPPTPPTEEETKNLKRRGGRRRGRTTRKVARTALCVGSDIVGESLPSKGGAGFEKEKKWYKKIILETTRLV